MKKVLVLLGLLLVVSCFKEDTMEMYSFVEVPENLKIIETSGVRLENYIVEDEVSINIKLPETATYRVKLLDIESKTVSQEKIDGNQGDNILKVYVKSLPNSSYTLQVVDGNGNTMGTDLFSKI